MSNQKLIEDNINLVYFVVNEYFPSFLHDEDIIQAGMVGLCRAANTWKEDVSAFSTFACRCIVNEIRVEFRRRNKHKGLLSLDYEVNGADGSVPFGDLLEGSSDIDYVDVEPVMNKLTPVERKVFSMLISGLSQSDVGRKLGISRQRVNQIMRKIKLVWRNYNGD